MNAPRADRLNEVIEPVLNKDSDMCELTEGEISQVVGGDGTASPDSPKGGHN